MDLTICHQSHLRSVYTVYEMSSIDNQLPHHIAWEPICKYKFLTEAFDENNIALRDEISMAFRNELLVTISE